MPALVFNIPYGKNQGLVISPNELLDLYFYGIQIKNNQGTTMSQETIKNFILGAQETLEKFLNIKIAKQVVTEDKDWYLRDWELWGYIRATYPVTKPLGLEGFLNSVRQVIYPVEWLSARKTSDGETYHRHMYLVPSTQSPTSTNNSVVYAGVVPHLGFMGNNQIPNYWSLKYETGFCKVPRDLMNAIGMMAALQLFYIMGDILISPGVNSQSISIDGLSQNISTQGAFKTRIDGYIQMLREMMPKLSAYYKGFTASSL